MVNAMIKKYLFLFIFLFTASVFSSQNAGKKVALVKIVKGSATFLSLSGDKDYIRKGMWLTEGTIVKTEPRSFVKLSFIDKSSMNIGPKSELKIEKFSKDEAGVINILTGKIRSKVTKDYLQMNKDKSKLFIKSKSAVMGIRGTDFLFSTNKVTGATTAVLFEGKVVFNKINPSDINKDLESIVNRGRVIKPGEFSVVKRNSKKATVPSRMSSRQVSQLEDNENFINNSQEKKNTKKLKSIVPPGLSGEIVQSDSDQLRKELSKVVKINISEKEDKEVDIEKTKGFIKGDDVKPVDGSIVHIDTGTIIPLGVDSKFDKNTGEWVSTSIGSTDTKGEYVPPTGFVINEEGKLLKVDGNNGPIKEVVLDVKPLDQTKPLEKMETVEYKGPAPSIKQGPRPASLEDIKNEFDKDILLNPDAGEIQEDGSFLTPDGQRIDADGNVYNPDGSMITSDGVLISSDGEIIKDNNLTSDSYLPPPPKPGDCSTCNQPTTLFNSDTSYQPPRPGNTRVNIKVNKVP